MEFKGLTLDDFQVRAIEAIDRNNSCVVSASTGTGKTLIAEYIISKHLPEGNTIIYTAPIKALSNQKYKDFCNDYGKEQVGLLTGDLDINHDAPILIMTTEIYRNMLLTNDPMLERISYVIFDEVHYINDIQRGSVWEESIIFSPKHIRFLALSATIPNYREFADWIETIKGHTVETVFYGNRPVPLDHLVFDRKLGVTTIAKVQADKIRDEEMFYMIELQNKKKKKNTKGKSFTGKPKRFVSDIKPPHHTEAVAQVLDKMPALYFCFSRKKTEDFARELAGKKNFLSIEEEADVVAYVNKSVTKQMAPMDTTKLLRRTLANGIGFHHSGMLPGLKNIVEHLFGLGLIKLLYTTETFSVGINMPAKCVIFDSLEKYDGINFRMLNAKEYFQIAGRAGRRGIDTEGTVISLVNRRFTDLEKLQKISTVDDEPIISRFKLSTNTTLNTLQNYDDKTQEVLLKSNFDYYVRTKQRKAAVHVMGSFRNTKKKLEKLNYIERTDKIDQEQGGAYLEYDKEYGLTEKGLFARNIYSSEVALTELFFLPKIDQLSDLDLLIMLASIVYESRRNDHFVIKGYEKTYDRILKFVKGTQLEKEVNKISLKRMIMYVKAWANGAKFLELMEFTNLQEGDIVRFFRRLIDVINQLKHATNRNELKDRLEKLRLMIDRDLIAEI